MVKHASDNPSSGEASAVARGIHWLWYYPLGVCSLSFVAQIAAFFLPKPHPSSISGLTYWAREEPFIESAATQPVSPFIES